MARLKRQLANSKKDLSRLQETVAVTPAGHTIAETLKAEVEKLTTMPIATYKKAKAKIDAINRLFYLIVIIMYSIRTILAAFMHVIQFGLSVPFDRSVLYPKGITDMCG